MRRLSLSFALLLPLVAACESASELCAAQGHQPGTAAFRQCEEQVWDRWAAERRARGTYTRSGGQ